MSKQLTDPEGYEEKVQEELDDFRVWIRRNAPMKGMEEEAEEVLSAGPKNVNSGTMEELAEEQRQAEDESLRSEYDRWMEQQADRQMQVENNREQAKIREQEIEAEKEDALRRRFEGFRRAKEEQQKRFESARQFAEEAFKVSSEVSQGYLRRMQQQERQREVEELNKDTGAVAEFFEGQELEARAEEREH